MDARNGPLVLIVDDDSAIRCLIETLMKQNGFEIDSAAAGDEALEKLRTKDYSVILLDLMLPRINGFEIIRQLKSVRRELLSRVIVLTAASDLTLRHFTEATLLWKLIRKPFDIEDLISNVRACSHAHEENAPELRREHLLQ